MPEFLLVNARGSLGESTHAGLRQALSRHAGTVDDDLVASAAEYRHYNGRAWDRLNNTDPTAESATESAATEPFEDWFSAVTELDHVYGTLLSLPTAWDGAIKFQSEQGTLAHFDLA